MSKHITDAKRGSASTTRAAQFARIEAGQRPSRQAKLLQRRPAQARAQTRARRFVDIARKGDATG